MKQKQFELLEIAMKNMNMLYNLLQHPYIAYFLLRYIAHPLLFRKETDANKLRRFGFKGIGGGLLTPEELNASKYGLKAMLDTLGGALESGKNNDPVVWFDWAAPTAIVKAFDTEIIVPSIFNVLSNNIGTDGSAFYTETAENEGISPDICSGNKIAIGAYLLNQLPKPSVIVGSSHPCDSNRSQSQILSFFENVPTFISDAAYARDEDALNKSAQSTWDLIRFLEKHLGKKINWDKLKSISEELNQFNYYFNEITEMHRAIPSPALAVSLYPMYKMRQNVVGSPDATKMAEELYKIAKKRVSVKRKWRANKEKIRIIMVMPPLAFAELYKWMEKEFGAVVVSDYIGGSGYPEIDTSSEESIIKGITLENLHLGMTRQTHGTIEFTTDELERIIDEFSGDCLIYNSHIACKQNLAADKIIKDVCTKSGLPVLFMEVDIFDKRLVSEEEIKRQIKDFFMTHKLS